MTAKSEILTSIRRLSLLATPAPDLDEGWITYADREKQFRDVLTGIGGHAQNVASPADIAPAVRNLACFADAKQIVCELPTLYSAM